MSGGPPGADRRTRVTPDLSVVRERALDDINNMRTMRNERRAEKREYDENVLGDESIMGMDDYLAMTTVPGMTASPGQGLPLRAVTPPHPPPPNRRYYNASPFESQKICLYGRGCT